MNCLEFRRRFLEEPAQESEPARAHRESCDRCRHWHAEAQQAESRLRRALRIPVPEDLAASILLAQTTEDRSQRRQYTRRRTIWAMAAGLVLAVGATGALLWSGFKPPLTQLAAEHMGHEPEALALRAALDSDAIATRLRDAGAQLVSVPGTVTYVQRCPLGLHRSLHLVALEDGAPVTVFFVPGARLQGDRVFEQGPWHGRQHAVNNGLLIVIGTEPQSLDRVETRWVAALGGQGDGLAFADSSET